MLTLYIRPGCPYCAKVLKAGEDLGIPFDLKSITNPEVAKELVARGGKQQVPYLVDEEKGVEMYESDAIIEHLHASFTAEA
ncbi:MAG: glutathione S-transferase N-terminal domain-containing protein [Patescibacteria group bacterium]